MDALGERIKPAGGRWFPHMLIFRAEWFKPICELTSQEVGDYRSWLRRNLGQMSAPERRRAKTVLEALTAERGARRRRVGGLAPPALFVRAGAAITRATAIAVVAEDAQAFWEAVFDYPTVAAGAALNLSDVRAIIAAMVEGQEFSLAFAAAGAPLAVMIEDGAPPISTVSPCAEVCACPALGRPLL